MSPDINPQSRPLLSHCKAFELEQHYCFSELHEDVPDWLEPGGKNEFLFQSYYRGRFSSLLISKLNELRGNSKYGWSSSRWEPHPGSLSELRLSSTWCNRIDRNRIQEYLDNEWKQRLIADAFGCLTILIILLSMNMQIRLRWDFWGKSYPRCSLLCGSRPS